MTMNSMMSILRKKNKEQYHLLGLCIFLSVLLVFSFTFMFFSPAVQELLPPGGDTRKLMWLMLFVVVIGCLFFTLYGSSLFFRNKSREFGILLALGTPKRELARQLARELVAVVGKYIFAGVLFAIPVSYLIWKLFQKIIIHTVQIPYLFGINGLLAGLYFIVALSVAILVLGIGFIRRTNIMEILNASRKTEMVQEINPHAGTLGAFLTVLGLFLAIAVPQLTVLFFRQGMLGIWNLTYLLCAIGLYLIMLSAVAQSKKGKNPKNYYKHIISTNLMRFTARQTTRNMCVIALLVFVMILSAFWGVMYYNSAMEGGSEALYDYSIHYPAKEQQITQKETFELAKDYQISITDYQELDSLELIIHYTGRDMDNQHRYFDVEYEKLASFFSASDYTRITGIPVNLKKGEYLTITTTGYLENIWVDINCLNAIEHPITNEHILPSYQGSVELDNLAIISHPFAFLLSDEDYQFFSERLTDDFIEKNALFNVKELTKSYEFAKAWRREVVARATSLSNHYSLYDSHEEALALSKGETYSYTGELDLSSDNPQFINDWKYAPFSKILLKAEAMELVAVFVLLSLYISVITLTAAGIMSYVRSITIAIDNRQLFEDLKKLGANDAYEKYVIKMQLRKIFAYPIAAGCVTIGIFSLFLTYFNDMTLQAFEVKMLLIEGLLMLVTSGVLYGVYQIAYRRTKQIVGIGNAD